MYTQNCKNRKMANSVMSLCIPRIKSNITRDYVKKVFDKFSFGKISKIDMVCKNMEKYQRVFIHFEKWNETDRAVRARQILESGKDIKVVHDGEWFWKVSLNRARV
jgi:hypothetical protein